GGGRDTERQADRGGEVAAVHGELEGPCGQVLGERHHAERGRHQAVVGGFCQGMGRPLGQVCDHFSRGGAEGCTCRSAALGHVGRVDVGGGPEVVGGGVEVDRP